MEQSAEPEFVAYVRQWLDKYPDDPFVPKLVGAWLVHYKSGEAIEYAITLVCTAGDTSSLCGPIDRCVTDSKIFEELEVDLTARREREQECRTQLR